MNNEIMAVIGGDKRSAYLAGLLAKAGITVFCSGMEKSDYIPDGVFMTDTASAIKFSGTIVLPLPASKDGETLNAPFSEKTIKLSDIGKRTEGKQIFAGMAGKLLSSGYFAENQVLDYYNDEQLLIENALLTAEGAVAIASQKYFGMLSGAKCLITGYGRIGKFLLDKLIKNGAVVYVAARKKTDLAWIKAFGANAVKYDEIQALAHEMEIVFNTVPAPVLGKEFISQLDKSSIIIDLASAPGGTDFESAKDNMIEAVLIPGIPGQYSPLAAARIIMDTIFGMIKEAEQ